jgi:DNA polymerase-3 subunit epsilon
MARKKFPGSPASLDALCKRFGVDNKARNKHGALLDAELLAQVYLELIGGKQPGLSFNFSSPSQNETKEIRDGKPQRPPRPHAPTPEELVLHQELLAKIKRA